MDQALHQYIKEAVNEAEPKEDSVFKPMPQSEIEAQLGEKLTTLKKLGLRKYSARQPYSEYGVHRFSNILALSPEDVQEQINEGNVDYGDDKVYDSQSEDAEDIEVESDEITDEEYIQYAKNWNGVIPDDIDDVEPKVAEAQTDDKVFKAMDKEEIEKASGSEYTSVGVEVGLNDSSLKMFIKFMGYRFPGVDKGYAYQWAKRFKKNTAWAYADIESRKDLVAVGYVDYIERNMNLDPELMEAGKNDKVFKPQSDKEIKAAGGNPKKARHGYGYYYFKLRMAGLGKDIAEAWEDAISGFTDDPGDIPDEYEFEPEDEM